MKKKKLSTKTLKLIKKLFNKCLPNPLCPKGVILTISKDNIVNSDTNTFWSGIKNLKIKGNGRRMQVPLEDLK